MASLKQHILTVLHLRPLWRVALLASVIAIIFLATTDTPFPVPSSPNDKVNHLVAFIELTLLARLSWPEARAWHYVPLLLAFGFAIEVVQSQLPYRDFSLADLATDGAGIVIGMLPWPGLRGLRKSDLRDSPESL